MDGVNSPLGERRFKGVRSAWLLFLEFRMILILRLPRCVLIVAQSASSESSNPPFRLFAVSPDRYLVRSTAGLANPIRNWPCESTQSHRWAGRFPLRPDLILPVYQWYYTILFVVILIIEGSIIQLYRNRRAKQLPEITYKKNQCVRIRAVRMYVL